MPVYRYRATNNQGQPVQGQLESATEEIALETLAAQGLSAVKLESVTDGAGTAAATGRRMTAAESDELLTHVVQADLEGSALAGGLQAAADECTSSRVAAALRGIAAAIERGNSLDEALLQCRSTLPAHVRGLVAASTRSGRLGDSLVSLVEHQRRIAELRRMVLGGFIYPLFVTGLGILVLATVLTMISAPFKQMMTEFGLTLPLATQVVFWWSSHGIAVISVLLSAVVLLTALVRLVAGRVGTRKAFITMPLVGRLRYWSAISEWCFLMYVLLKARTQLGEALRLAADGLRDPYVAGMSERLAKAVDSGQRLSNAAESEAALPASLVPLLTWGEKTNALDESFESASELFRQRTWARGLLVQQVLPPLLFVCVASVVVFVIAALFFPLVNLISALS